VEYGTHAVQKWVQSDVDLNRNCCNWIQDKVEIVGI